MPKKTYITFEKKLFLISALIGTICILIFGLAGPVHAQPGENVALEWTSDPWCWSFGNPVVMGWQFTPTTGIEVTALGWYDGDPEGLWQDHAVGIYRVSDQALLDSVVISNESSLHNGYRYETINPLVLSTGLSYRIAGYNPSCSISPLPPCDCIPHETGEGGEPPTILEIAPQIAYEGYVRELGDPSELTYPTEKPPGTPYWTWGPNFKFIEFQPEPYQSVVTEKLFETEYVKFKVLFDQGISYAVQCVDPLPPDCEVHDVQLEDLKIGGQTLRYAPYDNPWGAHGSCYVYVRTRSGGVKKVEIEECPPT